MAGRQAAADSRSTRLRLAPFDSAQDKQGRQNDRQPVALVSEVFPAGSFPTGNRRDQKSSIIQTFPWKGMTAKARVRPSGESLGMTCHSFGFCRRGVTFPALSTWISAG